MNSGYYAACSGLRARIDNLDLVAHNLANVNTVGFSSSQVDQRKVGKLALAIQVAFQELGVFPASTAAVPMTGSEPMPFNTVQAIENVDRTAALGRIASPSKGVLGSGAGDGDLFQLRSELEEKLAPQIKRQEVALRVHSDGLVISLREVGFFDSGSSQVKEASKPILYRIANVLLERRYRIRIEGHTDKMPIHTSQFASNWELSTSRATELVRLLIVTYGFDPGRLSAAGYAEFHPVADNTTVLGRQLNRRVDIVVLGEESHVNSILPPTPTATKDEHPALAKPGDSRP